MARRLTLTQTRIAYGLWEGLLTGADGKAPAMELSLIHILTLPTILRV